MECCTKGGTVAGVLCKTYIITFVVKRVAGSHHAAQSRHVRGQIGGHGAAYNYAAVQCHADIVHTYGQMLHIIIPDFLKLLIAALKQTEKLIQTQAQLAAYAGAGAICLKTAAPAACTGPAVVFDTHVAKLTAALIAARKLVTVNKGGATYASG